MSHTKARHKIFVYGTLKRGQYFHDKYLSDAVFFGRARTSNDFTLYVDALPYLVREASDGAVSGELFEVSEEELKKIDELEGHPNVYKREVIDVLDDNNIVVSAWAYLYPNVFKGKKHIFREYEWV